MKDSEVDKVVASLTSKDITASGLRKIIEAMMKKAGQPDDDEASEKKNDEREQLADLHEEHKGNVPKVPVTDEDLPGVEDDEDEEEDKKAKPGKKRRS